MHGEGGSGLAMVRPDLPGGLRRLLTRALVLGAIGVCSVCSPEQRGIAKDKGWVVV